MQLSHGAIVAIADGEKLNMYRNTGTQADIKLETLDSVHPSGDNKGSGNRHYSSAGNPDASQLEEDSFAAATAAHLNKLALDGKFDQLVVIAAPRTLGELRKHWHKVLEAKLAAELSKDLTGHSVADIEAALIKHK